MKCRSCRAAAIIEVPRHHAAFCADCFVRHCREQLQRAVRHFEMLTATDRVLVAVSGGKDSLALWDLLLDLGYRADGLYLGLGIPGYSDESARRARAFAEERGASLRVIDLPGDVGFAIGDATRATRRPPCSACGLSKRHLFNSAALEGGYDALATGHNLDDEVAVLWGNVMRWNMGYLGRQQPVLPGRDGFVRKIKPLVRLSERETAAYCVVRGIDYVVEECPMAVGNRHIGHKEQMNEIEQRSPGTKAAFYFGFLERVAPLVAGCAEEEREDLHPCPSCSSPTVSTL